MTFRHLEIFIAVAECKTMRAAAARLYISQPSVSQAIKELEEHFDVKLFERMNQRIYITDSGKKLLTFARHIMASVNECEEELKNVKQHPLIRIGSSVSVGTVLLDNYIRKFEKSMNNADIRVTVDNTAAIEDGILSNELDIGIVEGNVQSEELKSVVLDQDELFMIVGKKHPFFNASQITLQQLEGQSLISREDGSRERNQYEQYLKDKGINMITTWKCTNVQTIINCVKQGRGIAILSNLLVQDEINNDDIRVLKVEDIHITRQIRLIYHKSKYLTDVLNKFIEACGK